MVRTQIQLTEQQYKQLKQEAVRQGVSMAELIREGVEHVLGLKENPPGDEMRQRALALMDKFSSGKSDVARRHDDYLAEGYK
jgi:hypothetical protein